MTGIRIWDKEKKKDVTVEINVCLHWSGKYLIQLFGNNTWKMLEKDKYDVFFIEKHIKNVEKQAKDDKSVEKEG